MEDIVIIRNLVKSYNNKIAISSLDLSIRKGEIFGFLGPNGAGKTTTIRAIASLIDFDEGEIVVGGFDIRKDPRNAKRMIGVIPQSINMDKDLTVRENMTYHAMLQKLPRTQRETRIRELAGYVGLNEYLDRMIDTLSGGWKRRAAIVCSLIHNPEILFLDEPTAGLDIQARRLLWDLIRKLNGNGTTIFLTSHYIEEVEFLCDRVGIINHGNIIGLGTPPELCERIGTSTVEYSGSDRKTTYRHFSNRDAANAFATTLDPGNTVLIRNTSLEDCFVELTGSTAGGDK